MNKNSHDLADVMAFDTPEMPLKAKGISDPSKHQLLKSEPSTEDKNSFMRGKNLLQSNTPQKSPKLIKGENKR